MQSPERLKGNSSLARQILSHQAVSLREMGLSVLPIGAEKRPTLQTWKHLQTAPANLETVRRWFSNPAAVGIGIILGAISGDLVARDFDESDSYRRWADAFSDLAAQLPTAKTRRGYHVYARIPGCQFLPLDDGELRAGGNHYVIAPPSILSEQSAYSWVIPLNALETVPILNVDQSGFGHSWRNALPSHDSLHPGDLTERAEPPEEYRGGLRNTEEDGSHSGGVSSDLLQLNLADYIRRAISATCPKTEGQRNNCLFEFARWLKSRPEFADADASAMEPFLRQWYDQALPFVGTKDFDETRGDFIRSYRRVRFPKGQSPLDSAFLRAQTAAPPAMSLRYEDPRKQQLAALCRELQRTSQPAPFFLSCRTVANLFNISHQSANTWLFVLEQDQILTVDTRGTRGTGGKATRFRYIGGE